MCDGQYHSAARRPTEDEIEDARVERIDQQRRPQQVWPPMQSDPDEAWGDFKEFMGGNEPMGNERP